MKKMSFKEFMYLFMALNCYQNCGFINLDILKSYLTNVLNLDCEDELIDILNEMDDNDYISIPEGFEYIMKFNNNFPYQEIILNNSDSLKDVLAYLTDYTHYTFMEKKDIYKNDGYLDIICNKTKIK